MIDRPLTDAQERALIQLVEQRGTDQEWANPCRDRRTLQELSDRGLVVLRLRKATLTYRTPSVVAKATDKGVEWCNSMGD